MKTLKQTDELQQYLQQVSLPREVADSLTFSMQLVEQCNVTQALYQKFIGDIVITNEKVVVQLNLHYLLNSFSPIRCAIEEARINIAHFSHHKFQSLTFEKLNVILSDVGTVCLKRAV